jgi:hypothetical protein
MYVIDIECHKVIFDDKVSIFKIRGMTFFPKKYFLVIFSPRMLVKKKTKNTFYPEKFGFHFLIVIPLTRYFTQWGAYLVKSGVIKG